ncbi:type VII secretion integral membrane protein EccD [Mycobacterium sp. E342]|uniref:type VII secretion integral membrane protein EccD n=1 Tax=Mycobacterium sp. E342 TaxID=1834147 RepID=UPI0007FD9BF4|nr:type VII secretion integral membrane protein EccD [Mycobacterium sp. E342]OBH25038.1 type VII secretion integral membrane protein EccD [Mycobacterium sp. E342]
MTGVSELRPVVAAPPARIRVSVLGTHTQVDVALPADIPVAALLPELVALIHSRRTRDTEDPAARDERRSFWVLTRLGGEPLPPEQTLRAIGIADNELLRLSERRALSPPTLYDDVVDAAARLNRTLHPAWTSGAAQTMGFVGLWLSAAAWLLLLLAGAPATHRRAVIAGAALTTLSLIAVATVAGRTPRLSPIAAATAWPPIALGAALGWTLAAPHGPYALAVASAILLGLAVLSQRIIGAAHWAYLGAEVILGFSGLAFLGRGLAVPLPLLAVLAATIATVAALAVPSAFSRLSRVPAPPVKTRHKRRPGATMPGFTPTPTDSAEGNDPGSDVPGAEQVWARVRGAALTRAGLLAGLAAVVATSCAVLQRTDPGWAALAFALVCATVLALRSRRVGTLAERAALAAPAVALTLAVCVQTQAGSFPLRLTGIGVLAVLATAATLAGALAPQSRVRQWCSAAAPYLDYAATGALIPVGLWVMGIYGRLHW